MARPRIVATLALAAAAVAVLGVLASSDGRPAREPRSPGEEPASRVLPLRALVPPDTETFRDPGPAVRVALPDGWEAVSADLTPRLARSYPGILAVATFDPRERPRRACGSQPDVPATPIGPRDALLLVHEELDAQPGTLPRQPRRHTLHEQLRRPRASDRLRSVFPWRCLNRPGIAGLHTWFRSHGRLIEVTAIAGERTSSRLRRELLGIAESLRVGPTPEVEVGFLPGVGRPSTRFRLKLHATHRTGRRGRRERFYQWDVHGPFKTACVVEHHGSFSSGPPGALLRAVLDPSRTKGGHWCRGRFRGVVTYTDAICRPRADSCDRTYHRRAGRFSFKVR
jgi:hypothetical protein